MLLRTLALSATFRRFTWNLGFLVVLLYLPWAPSCVLAQTNTGFSGFTEAFNPATSNILFTTTNVCGFFQAGDPIGLATVDGSPLNVFAWYGDLLYSGPATNLYLPTGHYFVEAPGDRNEFAVLPTDWSTLSAVGWSGSYEPDPVVLALANFLKLGWVRGAFAWDVIQAGGSNSWDWTSTDQTINAHYGLRKIEMDLEGMPDWMLDASTGTWKISTARFAQLFAQFAQAAAQRYSNLVDVVEVWNEPSSYDLPPTNVTDQSNLYVTMLAAARAAFPPSVKISGPVFNSPFLVSWAQDFADAGAGRYLDYDVFHDYEARGGAPDTDIATNPVWRTIPQRVQDNLAIFGKPIIVDEVGLYGQSALGAPNPPPLPNIVNNSGMSWTNGLAYTVQYAVMYAANNAILMPHLILASGGLTNNDEILGFDVNGRGPHPKTSAFLMSEYWVNGATFVDWRSPGTQVFLYAWQRLDNTSIVFAWTVDGQSFSLSTNTAFSITDIYGRSIQPSVLDAQPILFHTNSPDAAALLSNVVAALPPLDIPPVMAPLYNQNILTNQLVQFKVSATDPNNDPITYSAVSLPSGASVDPASGTFSWTPNSSQAGAYDITFVATDSAGLSVSNATLITVLNSETDGLIDWWRFDQTSGTIASDSAGSNPGALVGFNFTDTSGWTTGITGEALAFDGTNDYVDLDNSTLSLSNNFSISAWINPHNADTGYGVFFCLRSIYATSGFRFWITDNNLQIAGQTTTGWNQIYFALGQIQNNNWYHVVVVYDKSTLEVYLNGVQLSPANGGSPNWGGDFVMNPSGVTRIGAEFGSGPVGFFFNGLIDDVRVYNRTLIPAEVQALYQEGDQPPVLAPKTVQTVVAGQPLAFLVPAMDRNESNLVYSASSLPAGAVFNVSPGMFSWTPALSQTGTCAITFTTSTGQLTDSVPATIIVYAPGSTTLEVNKLEAILEFNQTSADSCSISASLNLPSGYNFAGKPVTVTVADAVMSFVLDSKGRGRNGSSTFSAPSYNKTTGLWTVSATLRGGSWRNTWSAYGLTNATVAKPGTTVLLPVVLAIDNESFTAPPQILHYTAQAGKTGTTR